MKNFFEAKNIKELCKILGIPPSQAAKAEIRRDLVIAIKDIIEKNEWTQAQAAQRANVGRTVITAIVNGNIQSISTDRLIDIAYNLGLSLQLKVA
jgi:predicted XRE-type DNA-binding protein